MQVLRTVITVGRAETLRSVRSPQPTGEVAVGLALVLLLQVLAAVEAASVQKA